MRHKGYHPTELNAVKIGQSYELFQGSLLQPIACDTTTAALGDATSSEVKLVGTKEYRDRIFPLAALIEQDPVAVLGQTVVDRFGPHMPLLLKMNQALGNSYQLHIKYAEESEAVRQAVRRNPWLSPAEAGGYLAKPESWYYFEPGLATLGLTEDCDIAGYRRVCQQVNEQVSALSKQVSEGKLSTQEAEVAAQKIIADLSPSQFVRRVEIPAGQVVDLSQGGVHHSWEADLDKFPEGNIVYEIQLDRMDTISTLRAFDQGKFKPDGSIRPLNIQDYFQHLDASPAANDPENLMREPTLVDPEGFQERLQLVRNDFYILDHYRVHDMHSLAFPKSPGSFQHWFIKSGNVSITLGDLELVLHRGESCFIPARDQGSGFGTYYGQEAEVLVAYVPA